MTYKTLAKVCAAISGSSIVYMITYEGTYFGWTVLFAFLAFAILFNALNEQAEEITMLHLSKEEMQTKGEEQEIDSRNNDPFYISDKFNPNYQKLMEEKKIKEIILSQNKNIPDSSQEEDVEMQVVFFKKPLAPSKKDNQLPQNNDEN